MKKYDDPLKQFMMKTLRNVYYLENVSQSSIEEVIFYLNQEYHDEGEILFRVGDPVEEIIFVASGSVSITVDMSERDVVIETLKEGSAMGFNGILKTSLHSFTARCDTKVSIYRMKKSQMKEIFNFCEDIYDEVKKAKDFFLSESMPCIDFCIPRHTYIAKSRKPYEVFRTVVHRLLRINQNLGTFSNAFDIIEQIKTVSII